ncbi:MAG: hypothetical protein MJH09_11540 [Cetobacterium sp.]|nr:hypothetical protein [Cetobacterium sp.]
MKKLILCFFALGSLAFGITDFPALKWGMDPKTVEIFYPHLKKEISIYPGTEEYSQNDSDSQISKKVFYFQNDKLVKIDLFYDKTEVTSKDVKNIFNNLRSKFGNTSKKEPIYEDLGSVKLTGNKLIFPPTPDALVAFKGVDTNQKGKLIDSNLILEYTPR